MPAARSNRIVPSTSYDVVDALDALVEALELADVRARRRSGARLRPGPERGDHGRRLHDRSRRGAVARSVLDAFGIPGPAVALELDIDGLLGGERRDRAFRPLSRFPASNIDLAFVLPDTVAGGRRRADPARRRLGDSLEAVRCFDEFRSDALGPGRRSLAFALRFRAPDRTLTDAEIAGLRQAAIDAVIAAHDAELRG